MHSKHSREMLAVIVFMELAAYGCTGEEIFVYPTVLQERTATKNLVIRLTDQITLNLQKSSILAETLLFASIKAEKTEIEWVNTTSIEERLYHDIHHQSSVTVQQRNGAVQVEGILSSNLRIKPVPESQRTLLGRIIHKIYEVQETKGNLKYSKKHKANYESKEFHAYSRSMESVPVNNFILEVHVLSDRAHNKNFRTAEALITYPAVMANAVNLRYEDMKKPSIRIRLVGITKSQYEPFAVRNQGTVDADKSLDALVAHNHKGRIPGHFDVLYWITGENLSGVENGVLDTSFSGLAYTGRLCTSQGVAEGEDIATSYSGARTMAHELAHTMGASHDKTPRCPWSEGFLMSYVDGGIKKYTLSPCSRDKIRSTLLNVSPKCRSVLSDTNYMTQRKHYPGQEISDRKYCAMMLRTDGKRTKVTFYKTPDLSVKCKMKCCRQGLPKSCIVVDILEGMSCSKHKTCRRGVCGMHRWP
ncbi:venom metalloproteinase antarease TserMP_A-like [Rhipicephalus microplus]|uniref:venom metalloproteinase antarease TserMP_A-like n=1 Tax=Rhipicephalus microplus TaxID=6941 RepID=UPI003F6B4631